MARSGGPGRGRGRSEEDGRRHRRKPAGPTKTLPYLARAHSARRVVRDLQFALEELRDCDTETDGRQLFRVRWVTCLTLARAVGHVLRNVDTTESPDLAAAVETAWLRWEAGTLEHQVWHGFINPERNQALKEYEFPISGSGLDTEPPGPVLVLVAGEALEPADAVYAALQWWREELRKVEEEAARAIWQRRKDAALSYGGPRGGGGSGRGPGRSKTRRKPGRF